MGTNSLPTGLRALYERFSSLRPPQESELRGDFDLVLIGPRWLRALAPSLLALARFGGFSGKRILSPAEGVNLFGRGAARAAKFPMRIERRASLIDGIDGVQLRYRRGEVPFPWPLISDELRVLDAETWLCMMVVELPLLRRIPAPFLLRRPG